MDYIELFKIRVSARNLLVRTFLLDITTILKGPISVYWTCSERRLPILHEGAPKRGDLWQLLHFSHPKSITFWKLFSKGNIFSMITMEH